MFSIFKKKKEQKETLSKHDEIIKETQIKIKKITEKIIEKNKELDKYRNTLYFSAFDENNDEKKYKDLMTTVINLKEEIQELHKDLTIENKFLKYHSQKQ